MVLYVVLAYALATAAVLAAFGLSAALAALMKRPGLKRAAGGYAFPLFGLAGFVALCLASPVSLNVFRLDSLWSARNGLLFLAAAVPSAVLVSLKAEKRGSVAGRVLQGIAMELIQRLFTQNLLFAVLVQCGVTHAHVISIVANAVLWMQFVLLQDIVTTHKIGVSVLPDLFATALFSVFAGFLYLYSGNIALPMLAHAAERLLADLIRDARYGKERSA